MELAEYQEQAQATDQLPAGGPNALIVPLLGMAGEVGSLLVEYKKHLREGRRTCPLSGPCRGRARRHSLVPGEHGVEIRPGPRLHRQEEPRETRDRWPPEGSANAYRLFDADYAPAEQLPRTFTVGIIDRTGRGGKGRVHVTIDGVDAGDPLEDNAYDDDGYRFHDVFHLAHAAKLGWSPVLRGKLLKPKHKRTTNPEVNEVEDGGRAIVIDEAIVAYVWEWAKRHRYLEGITTVDYPILKTIKQLTGGLEVASRSAYQWEEAILAGYRIFRDVRRRGQGRIAVDLQARSIDLVA